jgi:hypothetical protein
MKGSSTNNNRIFFIPWFASRLFPRNRIESFRRRLGRLKTLPCW